MNIGIVGRGFVGSAVEFGFSRQTGCNAKVLIYDKDKTKSLNSLEQTVNESDFIFVSVPTPSKGEGEIDLSFLHEAIGEINDAKSRRIDNIILIRSTVVPGTCKDLQSYYPDLNIVFNPEFFTERSAKFDFINQARFIMGGSPVHTRRVANLFKLRFGDTIPCINTTFSTAELIKYMCNCFFATKISFLNEMKLLANNLSLDIDWDSAVEGFIRDGRIGHSHINVPGHDGKYGFGGACFPKDIQALIKFGEYNNIEMNTLKGAWKTNLEVRNEKR